MDLNTLLRTQWDRVAAVGCTVLGGVLLVLGWIGVSGTAYVAEQAPYIASGGVGGLFLLAVGATLWVSADLRDEWRKLDRIEEALGEGSLRWVADDAVAPAPLQLAVPDLVPDVVEAPRTRPVAANGAKVAATRAKATPARTAGKPRVRAAAPGVSDA